MFLGTSRSYGRCYLGEQYERAQLFLDERLRDGGYDYEEVDPFQPAFDIRIDMPPGRVIRAYCRELDLTSGEVAVRWASDAGVFSRELFVSRVDGVVVMRIQVDGGHFDARVSLAPQGWQAGMVFEGTSRAESMPHTETTFRRWSDGEIVGIDAQQADGTTFGGISSVVAEGGSWSSMEGGISLNSATSATLGAQSPCGRAERIYQTTVPRVLVETDDRLRRNAPSPPRRASTPDVDV